MIRGSGTEDDMFSHERSIDVDLLARFAEDHYDEVFRYCARRLPTTEDAKDAVQEVFLRLVRSRALYESREKPLAYLYTCARNVCIDALRRSKPVDVLDEADVDRLPDLSLDSSHQDLLLADALARLPEGEREVIELLYGQDLMVSDVAATLGKSRFAIRRVERRALGKLRELLGDDED